MPTDFGEATSAAASQDERALVPAGDFFLFPANLWPSKNHERLLEAFDLVCERTDTPVALVLTGALTGSEELLNRHRNLPITHLGYVSPALLRLLYERATALTFFSLYEGFGIPLLEAFSVGTPVVCGNRGSVPEVAGDAALMCDPTDVGAMSSLMMQVMGDSSMRSLLIARGKERLRVFTWSTAAEQLAGGIERVVARSRDLSRSDPRRRGTPGVPVASDRATWARTPAAPNLPPSDGRPCVVGYWSDNWLDPRLEIILGPNAMHGPLRIEGIPVKDMAVTVTLRGRDVREVDLRGGAYEIVEIDLSRAPGDVISFSFSERFQDGERRVVSFLLQATNIFAEEDLADGGAIAADLSPAEAERPDADPESP